MVGSRGRIRDADVGFSTLTRGGFEMAVKSVTRTQVIPYIFYRDVPAALEWLSRAFGFTERMRTQTPRGGTHGEMLVGDQLIMMGQGSSELRMQSVSDTKVATQGVFVYLSDVDAHHERARAAGARIDKPPEDLPYGRSYTVRDLEGHPWFFTTPSGED
jgi:PhnB protein